MKSFNAGAQLKLGGFYLTGEYVRTKIQASSSNPSYTAYAFQLTNGISGYFHSVYNIVDPQKAHSDAFAISYRKINDAAVYDMSCFNLGSWLSSNGIPEVDYQSKAWYFTYQNVVSRNVVWTTEYQKVDQIDGNMKGYLFATSFQFFF